MGAAIHDRATTHAGRVRRLAATGAAALLFTLAPPVIAQTAQRPVVKPDDAWRFVEYYTVPSTVPTRHWVVTRVTPSEIEGTENGEPLRLTPELNVLDSPRTRESLPGALRFPLEVGKSWRYESDWLFKPKGSKGTMSVEVVVAGHEKVSVPAGEFDAFRIVATRKVRGASSFGSVIDAETGSTYWYAPAARAIVKAVNRNPYLGPSTVELVDYALQP
jgi:hypothetical protein